MAALLSGGGGVGGAFVVAGVGKFTISPDVNWTIN